MDATEKVEQMIDNPKKTMNKIAYPIILSLFLIMTNNIIDSVWVSGLGPEPLAAIGFVTPLFTILVGVGNGIGAGANSLISRYIGSKNRKQANNASLHSIIISIIVSILITILFLVFLKDLLLIMGAGSVIDYATKYGYIIFAWTFTIIMPQIIGGIFRSEGDMKKATSPLIISAILNMILDPIFIYILEMGIEGAAFATGLSSLIGLLIMIYWICRKKEGYIRFKLNNFKNNLNMYKDILLVGIPASLEQIILSALVIVINFLLTITAGPTAVAVYTAGWRVVSLGIVPAIGVGRASTTVAGIEYGAKNYNNIKIGTRYAAKLGFAISTIAGIIIYIFAEQIVFLFSYSATNSALTPLMTNFLRVMSIYIILIPFGITASNIFQGLGKGTASLCLKIIRDILVLIFAFAIGIVFGLGEYGIYYGMIIGCAIGSIIAYTVIELHIKQLKTGANNG